MLRWLQIVTTLVLLVCVLAICIAPLVDLPYANLRSYQMVVLMMVWLIATASLATSSALEPLLARWPVFLNNPSPGWPFLALPIERSCMLQC
ncbi:MAG TPA: hypothetical protein VM554_03475 [Acidisarcina sp.]|nr:hypothetical protein [Acidisarcina sp.]